MHVTTFNNTYLNNVESRYARELADSLRSRTFNHGTCHVSPTAYAAIVDYYHSDSRGAYDRRVVYNHSTNVYTCMHSSMSGAQVDLTTSDRGEAMTYLIHGTVPSRLSN